MCRSCRGWWDEGLGRQPCIPALCFQGFKSGKNFFFFRAKELQGEDLESRSPYALLCSFYGLMAVHHVFVEQTCPCSSLQVVEHLESDLGVQVQRVAIHKMKYSFQIWSAMMSCEDSEGQVCQSELAKALLWRHQLFGASCGEASQTYPGISLFHLPPQSSILLFLKLHSCFSLVVLWVEAMALSRGAVW